MKEVIVALIFSVNNQSAEVSERVFTSISECTEFVNMLAKTEVVQSDNSFSFITEDGWTFSGECTELKDYMQ